MTNHIIPKELKIYTKNNTGWYIHSQGAVHAFIAADGKSIVASWRYGINPRTKKPHIVYGQRAIQGMLGDDTYYRLTRTVDPFKSMYKNDVKLDMKRMFYIPDMNIIDILVDKKSRKYYVKNAPFGMYSVPREKVKAVSDEVIEKYDKLLAEVSKLACDYIGAVDEQEAVILKSDLRHKMRAHIAVLESVDPGASKWVHELDGLVEYVIDRAKKTKIRILKDAEEC